MSRANEPAYPCSQKELRDIFRDAPAQLVDVEYSGITLREHFAAMAMQGLLAGNEDGGLRVAELAVAFADHLLAELERKP